MFSPLLALPGHMIICRCWIEWRTDGSNEDWGWKFTATAEIKKVGPVSSFHG